MCRRTSFEVRFHAFRSAACCLAMALMASAHPPGEAGQHGDHEESVGISHRSKSMALPTIEGKAKPWSNKPVLNDESRFHFAVMTDRTGGHRPGVWMHAVRNLNLLRPEFAVSVGDLIEGYTDDEQRAEDEWKEFLGFIDELQMRFFFVAGNHDVTNPMLHKMWRKKFGREWYSFDYKDVHFLCLSSEDPSASLGEEQVEWAIKDLEANQTARWTFVFLHKPLWVYAERELAAGNPDRTNWKKIEAALGSRPHTVFAGHVHHYVQFERNGSEYYQLATTGGGSRLRGEPLGEFDHVVWVTMEKDGPRIANILLDGVLAPDVVTEESIERYRNFLDETRLTIKPILIETGGELQAAAVELQVANEFDDAISVDAKVLGLPLKGLTMSDSPLTFEVPPHDTKTIRCDFRVAEPLDYEQFRSVAVTGKIRSLGKKPLTAELTVPVTIDRRHACPELAVTVDGNLNEWSGDEEVFSETPTIYGARQQWQGLEDAGMRFRAAWDSENLYIAGVVTDDNVMPERDRLYFGIDTRSMEARLKDPRLGEQAYTIQLTPDISDPPTSSLYVRPRRGRLDGPLKTQLAIKPESEGYAFELAVPISLISKVQGEDWRDFQMNAVIRDVDAPEDDNVYLSWRPTSDSRNNTNYGFFFRDGKTTSEAGGLSTLTVPTPSAGSATYRSKEIARFDAPEAVQAVAVDAKHFYAIANSRIGKYDKRTGDRVATWSSTDELPLKHLNSGIVMDGKLYCAHSNYPTSPETSSVEIWDAVSLEHIASHSFGIYEGSLTWIDQRDGAWWAVFAHYNREGNDKTNRWTSLVKFDTEWRRLAAWTFPDEVVSRFTPNSCSGGSWGPDGMLYCSGHDLGELYRLELPRSGSILKHVDTIELPITGQGFAWDRNEQHRVFGINRPKRQVVVAEIDLP